MIGDSWDDVQVPPALEIDGGLPEVPEEMRPLVRKLRENRDGGEIEGSAFQSFMG